jgi:alanine racemase
MADADGRSAGAVLRIDLDAIRSNYRLLRSRAAPAECAAVVKADAYGLGVRQVAPVLAGEGCRVFFVAFADEGVVLRQCLDRIGADGGPDAGGIAIQVLGGLPAGSEPVFVRHRLIPVLNSLAEVEIWNAHARRGQAPLPASLHVDTGMSRLGLPAAEVGALCAAPERLRGIRLVNILSHLACADEPGNELNRKQLAAFQAALACLPPAPPSLANSSGIFLGPPYHLHMVRPGIALYGGAVLPDHPNPMTQVVRLQGKILQVREIDRGQTVGYGATHRADRRERIATVGVGYADGYLRSLSNRGCGYVGGRRVPLVGRVSMDLVTFDVTGVPIDQVQPGAVIDLIGPHNPIDRVAADAGTIGYEILTSLGSRYHRVYAGQH